MASQTANKSSSSKRKQSSSAGSDQTRKKFKANKDNVKKKKFTNKKHSSSTPTPKSKSQPDTSAKNRDKKSQPSTTTTTKTTTATTLRPRKHAEVVSQAKFLWNQLRQKSNTKEQIQQLMNDLLPLIQGKIRDLCRQHDAARVIQAALQFGSLEQRRSIIREMTTEKLVDLAKCSYGHFCLLKAIQYCGSTDEICKMALIQSLRGSIPQLAVHATACRVVEALYTALPRPQQQQWILMELYGPHIQYLSDDHPHKEEQQPPPNNTTNTNATRSSSSLAECLKRVPNHQKSSLEFILRLISKGMEKNLYALTYFQELLCEYCGAVSGAEIAKLLLATGSSSVCDSAILLLNSRMGTRALCYWIEYGTAKDRKAIGRSLKGFAKSGLLHPQAYLSFLQLVRLTDDTVLIHKYVLNELLTNNSKEEEEGNDQSKKKKETNDNDEKTKKHALLDLALSESASKFLLFVLLMNDNEALQKVLDPYEWYVLGEMKVPIITVDGVPLPTSKKDATQKRDELLRHLQQPLLDLCTQHARELLLSRSGSVVLRVVYQTYRPATLVQAVIAACQENPTLKENDSNTGDDGNKGDDDDDEEEEDGVVDNTSTIAVLSDRIGHLAVKHLIHADKNDPAALFSQAFCGAHNLTNLAIQGGNRGAFVVAALFQVPAVLSPKNKVHLDKSKLVQQIANARKKQNKKPDESVLPGIEALLKEIDKASAR